MENPHGLMLQSAMAPATDGEREVVVTMITAQSQLGELFKKDAAFTSAGLVRAKEV